MTTPVKLNLGCFDKKLPGFVNVDIRQECNPDVVDDAFSLNTFEDESVDLVYASHIYEHLPRDKARGALQTWFRVLKPGGILRLAVPDFDAIVRRYIYTGDYNEIKCLLFGSQKHPFDFHYECYTYEYLKFKLESVGFEEVGKWNWYDTDPHRYIDDFSSSYLPSDSPDIALSHGRVIMGKGTLMSLNVECVK